MENSEAGMKISNESNRVNPPPELETIFFEWRRGSRNGVCSVEMRSYNKKQKTERGGA